MTSQGVSGKESIKGVLAAIAALLVIQSLLVLIFRNDIIAFGLLVLLAALLLGACLFIKGKR